MLANGWDEIVEFMTSVAREKVNDGSWARAEQVIVPRFRELVQALADIAAKKRAGQIEEGEALRIVNNILNRLKADVILERTGSPPWKGANWEDAAEVPVTAMLRLDQLVTEMGWELLPPMLWKR